MGRALLRVALLALAFCLATYGFGWWGVPAVAAVWGGMSRGRVRTGVEAGAGAAAAWVLLLAVPPIFGAPTFSFGTRLAAAMSVPVWALVAAEVVFPFAAAWSAATVVSALFGARGSNATAPSQ